VVVLVPELEEWLWYCENAVHTYCDIPQAQLQQWLDDYVPRGP